MRTPTLALLAITSAAASAQMRTEQQAQQQGNPQVIVGHPISRIPPQPPPTLPLRALVTPPIPNGAKPPIRTVYVPAPYPYYPYPYSQPQQSQTNVNVNVTNVIETPPAVTMIAPVMMAPQYSGGGRIWDAEADLAEENARARRGEPDARRDPGEVEPTDVKSPEAIVGALYDVLSGPRGTTRNWDRFRGLFADGARLIATRSDGSGPARPTAMTVEDYTAIAGPALEGGVYQREVTRSIQQYGAIAHVFSTYECRHTTSDEKPFQRGINSIQLMNDGTRWWIMSVSWDSERPGMPIPAKYLAPAPAPASVKKQ